MGMAASQARYLGLTARKTNVEYEGQQINQARTALGNQSASLWNQMLGLTIPTVPSITDYTSLQYSFNDGINTYTISDIQSVDKKDADGTEYNKLVTYYFYEDVYKGVETTNSNPQVQKMTKQEAKEVDVTKTGTTVDASANDKFQWDTVNDKLQVWNGTGYVDSDYAQLDPDSDEYKAYVEAYAHSNNGAVFDGDLYSYTGYDADGNAVTKFTTTKLDNTITADTEVANGIVNAAGTYTEKETITQDVLDYYMLGNSKAERVDFSDKTSLVDQTAINQIINDFGNAGGITKEMVEKGEVYKYVKNGNTYYVTQSELEDCIAKTKHAEDDYSISSGIDYQPSLTQYYATTMKEKVTNTDYAVMDDASGSGRFANMKLKNMSTNFELTAEETTNQAAYNDAMNQYNYDLNQYEKQMADINAKTSLIQEQDRTLELRLKQLETEQKALTTEMEAVKGVLQKNVESTFGTFK